MLDTDDLVLAAMDASGGRVEGRTRLQKLVFFISTLMDIDAGYRPHFYGPYSQLISSTAESQASRGVLREVVESYPGTRGFSGNDDEYRRYVYILTGEGREALEWRQGRHPDEFNRAVELARTLVDSGADYRILSYAAKLYYVLKAEGEPITPAAARSRARDLGWRMGHAEIGKGVELLASLELIEQHGTSAS